MFHSRYFLVEPEVHSVLFCPSSNLHSNHLNVNYYELHDCEDRDRLILKIEMDNKLAMMQTLNFN